jgi:PKD repeat protein
VPYYWVLLIADDKQKQIFISEIDESEISDKDKIELKAKLLGIWKKYPMKFEKIGHTTYISPAMKTKAIILTKSENLTLQQMDMIHSFKEDITMTTPKWYVSPTHYDLVYFAAWHSGYPDPVTAAESSGYPDVIYEWYPPAMWYNPVWHTGDAPTHAQEDFVDARNLYQSGYVLDASYCVGYSSHYLTDVGNPLHTGCEDDQIIDYLRFHWCLYDVHTLYESYVASHWEDDFKSWVMDNEYSYKWDWNGADASTIAVATSSYRFVDTLYTKIYNNRAGFWNEDDWTREITRVCLMTSSQYNNGLINAVMLKSFPGYTDLPTDYDNDRDIEDLNGNHGIDFGDIVLYFNYMEWIETNEPIVPFDYNNNGNIDFNDLILLYNEV